QMDSHAISHHLNVECIPFTNWIVSDNERGAGIFLVVIQTTGSNGGSLLFTPGIPNLNLWRTTKVDATVTIACDLPIHKHFKVAVCTSSAQIVSLTCEIDCTILHTPALTDFGVSLSLLLGKFGL